MRLARVDRHQYLRSRWAGALCLLLFAASAQAQEKPRCLFVSSYHQGHGWTDAIGRGLRDVLGDRCLIRQFDMDTKRQRSHEHKLAAALQAKALIESWHPQLVITADDSAADYLIRQYYRDADLPFVFCGVNWTAEEYGFPYSNVTGMIEVAPVRAMIDEAIGLTPDARRVLYVGADTPSERKDADRVRRTAERRGLVLDTRLVNRLNDWLAAYQEGQHYDFIVVGGTAGIDDWDDSHVFAAIRPMTRTLTVTNHQSLMPYAMLGLTKEPREQGEWAARAALQILDGVPPSRIPIVANRKWELFLNPVLMAAAKLNLPTQLAGKAKVIH